MKILKILLLSSLFLFFSATAFTQDSMTVTEKGVYPEADFKSPRSTFRFFLKTMKGYKLGDQKALDLAIQALDLSNFDEQTRDISGKTAAIKLVNTIDRLEYVNFDNIPQNLEESTWVYKSEKTTVNRVTTHLQISLTKNGDGQWLFDKETLNDISLFESVVKNRSIAEGVTAYTSWTERIKDKMPAWTARRSFILLNGQWIGLLAVIFCGFLFERLMRLFVISLILGFLKKKGIRIDEKFTKNLTFSIGVIFFAFFWTLGTRLLELPDTTLSWFLRIGQVSYTVGFVIALYQLVDYVCLFLEKKAELSENKFDDILIPLIRKSAKTFVIAVGLIAIGDSLTLDMKGLLAGMGIAGLGISLAAKDTISNLFGSLTVLLDRPFRIGDWVKIGDTIEGTVEEVGLRSCRIRTFYNSLITIPNGMLTNANIDNLGVREFRRYSTKLNIQYGTPLEKVEAFCEGIREIIRKSPNTRKDYFHVYLSDLGSHSLDILLYVFFIAPDWAEELNERHRLLVDILRLGEKMGVEFAFPTQTLHMIKGEETAYDDLPTERSLEAVDQYSKDLAARVKEESITPKMARSAYPDQL